MNGTMDGSLPLVSSNSGKVSVLVRDPRQPSHRQRVVWMRPTKRLASLMGHARMSNVALSMTDAPAFGCKPFADMNITACRSRSESRIASFNQASIGDEAHPVALVGEVGPDRVVEDVRLDSLDRRRQSDDCLCFPAIFQCRGVDGHA